jgi:Thiamine pyrophosphate enzyme, C-terminal TPP binding domain
MACALPYAIAAQWAHPGRQCVAFIGDGGLAMLMAELDTAVRCQLPITVVVNNNASLSQIEWEQVVLGYPDRPRASPRRSCAASPTSSPWPRPSSRTRSTSSAPEGGVACSGSTRAWSTTPSWPSTSRSCWGSARRQVHTGLDFFLSVRSLPAWITGLAFIAANLGALEILVLAANGAKYGAATVHFYWIGAIPAMVFLGIVMPFYGTPCCSGSWP